MAPVLCMHAAVLLCTCWSRECGMAVLLCTCWSRECGMAVSLYTCWSRECGMAVSLYTCWSRDSGMAVSLYTCWSRDSGMAVSLSRDKALDTHAPASPRGSVVVRSCGLVRKCHGFEPRWRLPTLTRVVLYNTLGSGLGDKLFID